MVAQKVAQTHHTSRVVSWTPVPNSVFMEFECRAPLGNSASSCSPKTCTFVPVWYMCLCPVDPVPALGCCFFPSCGSCDRLQAHSAPVLVVIEDGWIDN